MKRPAVYLCLCVSMGILIGVYWKESILLSVFLFGCLVFYVNQFTYKKYIPFFIILCFLSIIHIFIILNQVSAVQDVIKSNDQNQVVCKLTHIEKNKDHYSGIAKIRSVNQKEFSQVQKMIIYANDLKSAHIGDTILLIGEVESIKHPTNPGQFNMQKFYYARNIYYRIYSKDIQVLHSPTYSIQKYIGVWRMSIFNRINDIFPHQEASILQTMLLGEDSELNEEISRLYQKSGIAHLLAISGLHVSILGFAFYKILKMILKEKEKSIVFFTISLLIVYCNLTGNSVSTIRATLMISLILLSKVVYAQYEIYSALSIAALCILIISPYQLFDVGFQLSFSAVVGIVYLTPKLEMKLNKMGFPLLTLLFASFSASLFTSPIVLWHFYEVPILSVIVNVFVIPVIPVILGTSVCSIFASYISLSLGKIIGSSAFLLLKYIEGCCKVIQLIPYQNLRLGKPPIWIIALFYMLLLFYTHQGLRNKYHFLLRKTFVIAGVLILSYFIIHYYTVKITFLDVGQGDASCIQYQGKTLLIDGGGDITSRSNKNVGTYILAPFLMSRGIKKIDGIFVSHSDFDHIYGIIELIDQFETDWIVLPFSYKTYKDDLTNQLLKIANEKDITVYYFKQDDYYAYQNLMIYCYYPLENKRDYTTNNSRSAVLKVTHKDVSILFTGDIEKPSEIELVSSNQNLMSDIIKVPHHGSKTSSTELLIKSVDPAVAIFSYGEDNLYGMPNSGVVQRYQDILAKEYHTSDSGAITIYALWKDAYRIRTYLH